KEKLKGEDTAEIRTATEKVAAVSQKLGQAMYAKAQAEGASGSGTTEGEQSKAEDGTTAEDEVVDAEIVDDDKREGSAG
ncbi:molecular chaperone DnaK, partial [Streptomyces sp. NPDC002659]